MDNNAQPMSVNSTLYFVWYGEHAQWIIIFRTSVRYAFTIKDIGVGYNNLLDGWSKYRFKEHIKILLSKISFCNVCRNVSAVYLRSAAGSRPRNIFMVSNVHYAKRFIIILITNIKNFISFNFCY